MNQPPYPWHRPPPPSGGKVTVSTLCFGLFVVCIGIGVYFLAGELADLLTSALLAFHR
jgi:hypothetical protein